MPFFATRETVLPPNIKEGADNSFYSDGNTLTTDSDGKKKQRRKFNSHLPSRLQVIPVHTDCPVLVPRSTPVLLTVVLALVTMGVSVAAGICFVLHMRKYLDTGDSRVVLPNSFCRSR